MWEQNISRNIFNYLLIIWLRPCDWGSDGFALHDSFLFSLREERDLVVDILQHDEYGGLAGQLLGSVILHTDGEVVLLDPLEVERLVDLHVGVGPAVLLPLLEVESVVLVSLVCRASD